MQDDEQGVIARRSGARRCRCQQLTSCTSVRANAGASAIRPGWEDFVTPSPNRECRARGLRSARAALARLPEGRALSCALADSAQLEVIRTAAPSSISVPATGLESLRNSLSITVALG